MEFNIFYLRILYLLALIPHFNWYLTYCKKYKDKYVIVKENSIILIEKDKKIIINEDDLSGIINANHQSFFKIFNVTHIFTKHGQHFYITSEINQYKKLKTELMNNFQKHFNTIDKTIRSDGEEDFLPLLTFTTR